MSKRIENEIRARKTVVKIMRQAREFAKWGWIKKGRTSVDTMVFDCMHRAYEEEHKKVEDENLPEWKCKFRGKSRIWSLMMTCAVQETSFRGVPGSLKQRELLIHKWTWYQYVTQDVIIRFFERCVDRAVADERAYSCLLYTSPSPRDS